MPACFSLRRIIRGIIIDVITARKEDLAANPKKYASFLKCIYKAVDFSKAEPDKYAELAAPHFGLTPADVKEILATSLAYTPLADAAAYMGKPGERGKLHDIFDTVMAAQHREWRGRQQARLEPADRQFRHQQPRRTVSELIPAW